MSDYILAYRVVHVWKNGLTGRPDPIFYTDYSYVRQKADEGQRHAESLGYTKDDLEVTVEGITIIDNGRKLEDDTPTNTVSNKDEQV